MPQPTPLNVAFLYMGPWSEERHESSSSLNGYLMSPLVISLKDEEDISFQLTKDKQADFRANKEILEKLYSEYDVVALEYIDYAAIEAIIHYLPNSMKHRCRFILMHSPERWIELY